jgi:hypothetical protein
VKSSIEATKLKAESALATPNHQFPGCLLIYLTQMPFIIILAVSCHCSFCARGQLKENTNAFPGSMRY